MSTGEAAQLLGYTVQHVRRLARNGELSGQKFGRDWMIHRQSADELLRRRLARREQSIGVSQ